MFPAPPTGSPVESDDVMRISSGLPTRSYRLLIEPRAFGCCIRKDIDTPLPMEHCANTSVGQSKYPRRTCSLVNKTARISRIVRGEPIKLLRTVCSVKFSSMGKVVPLILSSPVRKQSDDASRRVTGVARLRYCLFKRATLAANK